MAPIIADYWERAAFPDQLVPKLAKLGVAGATLEGWVLFAEWACNASAPQASGTPCVQPPAYAEVASLSPAVAVT